MSELRCPHCGQAFTVDNAELNSIIQQIRDREFTKDVDLRISELENHLKEKHKIELEAKENEITLKIKENHESEIEVLKKKLDETLKSMDKLKVELNNSEDKKKIAILEAKQDSDKKLENLKEELDKSKQEYESLKFEFRSNEDKQKIAIMEAVQKVENEKRELENRLTIEKDNTTNLLKQKDELIAYYKDLKTSMSTKMIGESLEQHCEIQFNQLRATAFKNAYFEKDNNAKSGSKGDYIYREYDENGVEIVSIMFEMKNEMETTATKHKNEDFYKELDKDRREKNCEYAILVSMLEKDSEFFNAGIVDVSYKYEKMYVVRPQCFIPIITLLRNAAMNSLIYKQELEIVRNQNIDVSNFEKKLNDFKDNFSSNYEKAHKKFDKAIDEIDKTIEHLIKVKEELLGSDNQLRIANNKVEEISIKKLTWKNPTMKQKFEEISKD